MILLYYFRTGIGVVTPIGEIAPGVPKKEKEILFQNVIAPGAILRMITVLIVSWFFQSIEKFTVQDREKTGSCSQMRTPECYVSLCEQTACNKCEHRE